MICSSAIAFFQLLFPFSIQLVLQFRRYFFEKLVDSCSIFCADLKCTSCTNLLDPALRLHHGNLLPINHIHFISYDKLVYFCFRFALLELVDLVRPALSFCETFLVCHVVNNDCCICSFKIELCQCIVPLLASCVPEIKLHSAVASVIISHVFGFEASTERWLNVLIERALNEPEQN